jgi:ribonuclease Z
VLGTAGQAPTRTRNHTGYLLRWDGQGFLFDPGAGTRRQMLLGGVPSSAITRICLTNVDRACEVAIRDFHRDHCLGVPGVVQRLSLDGVVHPVVAHFPASGREYFARLHHAGSFYEVARLREEPVERDGVVASVGGGTLEARRLEHPVEAFGYRFVEPDGRRMLPEQPAEHGISGPDVGRLQREGALQVGGRTVRLDEVSAPRRGQRFAFVMDTRICDAVHALADGVDLLVIESTFLTEDAALARAYGHLTARQAGSVAADCRVRRLVLTHFSQRYADPDRFAAEAAQMFDGDIVVAEDLSRVPVPPRRG